MKNFRIVGMIVFLVGCMNFLFISENWGDEIGEARVNMREEVLKRRDTVNDIMKEAENFLSQVTKMIEAVKQSFGSSHYYVSKLHDIQENIQDVADDLRSVRNSLDSIGSRLLGVNALLLSKKEEIEALQFESKNAEKELGKLKGILQKYEEAGKEFNTVMKAIQEEDKKKQEVQIQEMGNSIQQNLSNASSLVAKVEDIQTRVKNTSNQFDNECYNNIMNNYRIIREKLESAKNQYIKAKQDLDYKLYDSMISAYNLGNQSVEEAQGLYNKNIALLDECQQKYLQQEQQKQEKLNKAEEFFKMGVASFEKDDYKAAIDFFIKSSELHSDAGCYYNIAICYERLQDYEQAITYYTKALDNSYQDASIIYKSRGNCYTNLEKYDLAIKEYTAFIELKGYDKEILKNRAYCFFENKNDQKAIEDLEFILSKEDDNDVRSMLNMLREPTPTPPPVPIIESTPVVIPTPIPTLTPLPTVTPISISTLPPTPLSDGQVSDNSGDVLTVIPTPIPTLTPLPTVTPISISTLPPTPLSDGQVSSNNPGEDLINAAKMGNIIQVQTLLDTNTDINVKDKDNRTPLIWAVLKGYTDVVKILLDRGADVKVTTIKGKTALQYATDKGNTRIIHLLRKAGATK